MATTPVLPKLVGQRVKRRQAAEARVHLALSLSSRGRSGEAKALLQSVVDANRHEAAVVFARTLGEQVERGLFQSAGPSRG